jgi:putative ABC transport system permease protein
MSHRFDWRRYLRFFGPDLDADVADEMRFHIDTKIEELREAGWPPERARAEAFRQFGNVTRYQASCVEIDKEYSKRMHRAEYLSGWKQDIANAFRQLRKSIGFTTAAAVTLAVGIGAVTSIFSVIYAVVLRPLPFPEPDRIVTVWSTREEKDDVVIPRNFAAWKEQARSFTLFAAVYRQSFTVTDATESTQVPGGKVSVDFFRVFGVTAAIGRTFMAEEDRPGGARVAVLSHRLWRQLFGRDRNVVGREIHLNRVPHTVIGVMPQSFDLRPDAEQVWIPLGLRHEAMNWVGGVLYVYGRLQPHIQLLQAQAEMDILSRNLEMRYPELNKGRRTRVARFSDDLIGDYRKRLTVLLASVVFVLFIACSNVANLLLARGTARAKELAIRSALGATSRRLFRQLLTESAVLALISVTLGIALSAAGIRVVQVFSPPSVPRLAEASLNAPSIVFALILGLATTLAFGAIPAWRTLRLDLESRLKEAGRSGEPPARDWVRNGYIATEVGLALALLISAGLLIRSAIAAARQQPGFDTRNVLTARTALPRAQYPAAPEVIRAYERIVDEIATSPEVSTVSLSSKVPIGPGTMGVGLRPEAITSGALRSELSPDLHYIGSDYAEALGIPIRAGREFVDRDRMGSRQVILVNETLSRILWPGQTAVGKTIRIPELNQSQPLWEVVGVLGDVKERGMMQPPPSVLYVPFRQVETNPWQWTQRSVYLIVKTRVPPLSFTERLRQAVRSVDPQLPVGDMQSMEELLRVSVSTARLYTVLLTALGATGLLLTAIGIYSVVAYFVTQRRTEIALRVALGASPGRVLLLVVKEGMKPVVIGLVAGVLLASGFNRLLATQLYTVQATDPSTGIAVIGLLAVVAALASFLPALRAVRIEPMSALRNQ